MHTRLNTGQGFSLIEVLVTLIVLGVGLVAVAKFQSNVIESGALAKARTVAAHLAQQKLDDLRNYEALAPPASTTAAAASVFYKDIADNAGGAKNASGTLLMSPGTVAISSVTYTLNLSVVNYYYPKTATGFTPNTSATTTAPSPLPSYPAYKQITIPVTWTDQHGNQQQVQLRSIISAHDPSYSGLAVE